MIEEKYLPQEIEGKWQKLWEENNTFEADLDRISPE